MSRRLRSLLAVATFEAALTAVLPWWCAWFTAWAALATGWAALAYALNRPALLGKVRAPALTGLLLWPYLQTGRSVARAAQRRGLVERVEVVPGLWLGGWPSQNVSPLYHLDLTAELRNVARPAGYDCVPMLDGVPMSIEAWGLAVRIALRWRREQKPVLIHCAYGRGRSVAVLIGVLLAEGHEPDVPSARASVLALRDGAHMTKEQQRFLEHAWERERAALQSLARP